MKSRILVIAVILVAFTACTTSDAIVQPTVSSGIFLEDYAHLGLTESQAASLLSLTLIDDHPLYTMIYTAGYDDLASGRAATHSLANLKLATLQPTTASWACSLFAAFADPENQLYGRNFDWEQSPAVLLFTDPPDGYASASMVDITFLGFTGEKSADLHEVPLENRINLLDTPYLPFDGFNEMGLVVGMAAVSPGNMSIDPAKQTIGSLSVIRVLLDHAATVDEAISLMQNYNIDFEGGPPIHYLIADASGQAALVEYYQSEMRVTYNQTGWHLATNFIQADDESPQGHCWRYDTIDENLSAANGKTTPGAAMSLLQAVAQENTQWSIVYNYSSGDIQVVMGQDYANVHQLHLDLIEP